MSNASGNTRRFARIRGCTVAALVLGMLSPSPSQASPLNGFPETVPRSKRVVMFTDSVGLGAEFAMPRAFPSDWQVVVDGAPARMVNQLLDDFVRPRLVTNPDWFGDHVIIAGGYNYPYWDPARFDREIDAMVDTLVQAGVEHVYWVTLREIKPQYISGAAWRQIQPYYWYFPRVNQHLEDALERHPNLSLIDWRANADQVGLTYDAIHLNNTGAALYSAIARAEIDAASTRVDDGSITRIHVEGGAGFEAAAINLTTTAPRTAGFLTAFSCNGEPPTVSIHNYRRNEIVAHAGIVPLDAGGDFCVKTRVATNLVIDVTGLIAADRGFTAVDPTRWLDTRSGSDRTAIGAGETVMLDFDDIRGAVGVVGADVTALALVATSTEATEPGWLKVLTCGTSSKTSNVNYRDANPSPNFVVVSPDADGKVCITTSAQTHLVVDLFGVFTGAAGVVANQAIRVFDSRLVGGPVAAGSVTRFDVTDAGLRADAAGAILNLTAVNASAPGFATAYPCADGRPNASNLNVAGSEAGSNAALVAPDVNGEICVYSLSSMDLVIDASGQIGAVFEGITPRRVLDTRG